MFVAGLGSEQQEAGASNSTVTSATNNASAFQQLTQSLRRVFTARQGYPVYDNLSSKRQADYNVILVEKVRRKHLTPGPGIFLLADIAPAMFH